MSAALSPLEQLEQQSPAQPPQAAPSSNLSPLEQLEQTAAKPAQQPSQPVDTTHTVRAMQQTMGGPPMFVDVPSGTKDQFEQAGQEGYQKGGQIGAGLVAGGGSLAAAAPLLSQIAPHLPDLDKAWKITTALMGGSATLDHLFHVLKTLKGK